jgi:hypothetical protein
MQAYVKHTGAWMPWEVMYDDAAGERLRRWIRENVDRDQLRKRIAITPQKSGNAIDKPPILGALARMARWDGARNPGPPRYGMVVAAWPSEPELQSCIGRADDKTLIVFQWGDYLKQSGRSTRPPRARGGMETHHSSKPIASLDLEII